jgi:hypothetical protein
MVRAVGKLTQAPQNFSTIFEQFGVVERGRQAEAFKTEFDRIYRIDRMRREESALKCL